MVSQTKNFLNTSFTIRNNTHIRQRTYYFSGNKATTESNRACMSCTDCKACNKTDKTLTRSAWIAKGETIQRQLSVRVAKIATIAISQTQK